MAKLDQDFIGIYIVEKDDGKGSVTLTSFFNVLRGDPVPIKHINIPGIREVNRIGDDGKEVTFNPGDLLRVEAMKVKEGYAFHFANCAPSDEFGEIQYEYVKGKLGLAEYRDIDSKFIAADGQFRLLLTGKAMA